MQALNLCAFTQGEAGMPDDDSDSLGLAGEEDPLSD